MMKHEKIAEVAVVARPDEKWGETPVAWIVCRDGQTLTDEEMYNWIPTGKIQKQVLRQKAKDLDKKSFTIVSADDAAKREKFAQLVLVIGTPDKIFTSQRDHLNLQLLKGTRQAPDHLMLKVACGGVHNLAITEPDQSLAFSLSTLVNSEMLADVAFRSSEGSILYAHLCILKHNASSLHSYVLAQIQDGVISNIAVDGDQQIPLVALTNARKEVLLDFMHYVYTLDLDAATMSLSSFSAVLELYHLGDRWRRLAVVADEKPFHLTSILGHTISAMGRPKPPRLPGREARRWDDPDSDDDDDGQPEFHPQTDQGQAAPRLVSRRQRRHPLDESLVQLKAVILVGLSKAPQLNGKTGTVAAGVDGATGRCQVLLPDHSVKSLKVENLREVLTGAVVRLQGLQAAPELNGLTAECGVLDLTTQRYSVTLADGKETVIGRFLQSPKYLAAPKKPFLWKTVLQQGKDRERQSWSARLALMTECGLPTPHLVAGSQLVDAKSMVSPTTTPAEQLPLTEQGRLACRLLAVSRERDSCSALPTTEDGFHRSGALGLSGFALQRRCTGEIPRRLATS
eukprot:g22494.t1